MNVFKRNYFSAACAYTGQHALIQTGHTSFSCSVSVPNAVNIHLMQWTNLRREAVVVVVRVFVAGIQSP